MRRGPAANTGLTDRSTRNPTKAFQRRKEDRFILPPGWHRACSACRVLSSREGDSLTRRIGYFKEIVRLRANVVHLRSW